MSSVMRWIGGLLGCWVCLSVLIWRLSVVLSCLIEMKYPYSSGRYAPPLWLSVSCSSVYVVTWFVVFWVSLLRYSLYPLDSLLRDVLKAGRSFLLFSESISQKVLRWTLGLSAFCLEEYLRCWVIQLPSLVPVIFLIIPSVCLYLPPLDYDFILVGRVKYLASDSYRVIMDGSLGKVGLSYSIGCGFFFFCYCLMM